VEWSGEDLRDERKASVKSFLHCDEDSALIHKKAQEGSDGSSIFYCRLAMTMGLCLRGRSSLE
jgi:hypothetical protein